MINMASPPENIKRQLSKGRDERENESEQTEDNSNNMNKKISEFMKVILDRYSAMRGEAILEPNKFWDAVVISASDESQMEGYKKQIEKKRLLKEIPLGVSFHVFSDPPNYKIGCGGSLLFVLDQLFQIYEYNLSSMRILFIPAGGYSQRLPNLTALGKLFCPLPFGDANYQMLDLILATYLPFLENMQPGVFLASSDAIISYNLNQNEYWSFQNEGFTALAHPSPVSVGCNHGVYVLQPSESKSTVVSCMNDCLQVLQKPSVEEMHKRGAVTSIKTDNGDEKIVYSDSAYFFDHSIFVRLRKLYNLNNPLKYELSSYGDFLQPLGIKATPSYIVEDPSNNKELADIKTALYRDLNGTNLSVLLLKQSYFHHLGTMTEYLDSLCFRNKFSEVFPVSRFSFSSYSVSRVTPLYVQGTVMHSIVHPMSDVCESTLIEYSDLSIAVDIGENCIISNIQLQGFPVQRLSYKIPNNTLLHTAAVMGGFVTIACNIYHDIKRKYESKDSFDVEFFGKRLKSSLALDVNCFTQNCNNIGLWNAKIFPVKHSPEESFLETLRIISCKTNEGMEDIYYKLDNEGVKFLSMADVISLKDTDKMVQYQQKLYHKIKNMI